MERIADILLSESTYETGSSFSENISYEVACNQSGAAPHSAAQNNVANQHQGAASSFLSLMPDESPLPPLSKSSPNGALNTCSISLPASSAPNIGIRVVEVGVVEAGVVAPRFEANQAEQIQAVKSPIVQVIAAPTADAAQPEPAQLEPTQPMRADELWAQSVAVLRKQLDPQIFTAWIKPLQIETLEISEREGTKQSVINFVAPNRFCRDHIERHYSDQIRSTISTLLNITSNELIFRVAQPTKTAGLHNSAGSISDSILNKLQSQNSHQPQTEIAPRAPQSSKPPAAPQQQRRPVQNDESNLNPKYNFSNFVVGGCNQFAHAVSLRVAEDLGAQYNPLFIYGGVGLGKTHLANAIGNSSRRRNKKVLLVSSESFVSELISSLRSNRMEQFKTKFRSIDLLIIDDIQFIIGKERTQEEFFHTFNDLYNRHKQIILTSDKVPQELVGLEERLRTRFASGLSVDLQAPDYETRVAILIKKAENGGFELSEEVARLIAKHIDTNVRELEGALNKLQALSSLHQSPLSLSLAEQVLKSFTPTRQREITAETIQKVVAERFNVSINDLIGKRRTHNIAFARQVAMYLCRKLTGCSYPEIGALFGGRDHSTVIHANRSISEKAAADAQFTIDLDVIERRLSE